MLNAFVVILSIAKRIDVHNIYSRSSTTYNQILNSYFPEDVSLEDPEKLWDKWDALAEETVPIVERENIKSIKINTTKEIEDKDGKVVLYILEICYGKTRDINRIVLRRYREFYELYNNLKACNEKTEFPAFPKMTKTKNEVTFEVVKQRTMVFNELFAIIVKEKLNCPVLSKFLSTKASAEIVESDRRERIMSTIEENIFSVSIPKARKEETKFKTHAKYEVIVKCGKIVITTHYLFSDFKNLHKLMKKRYKNIVELPSTNLIKSSANPKVVKERRLKLESFLKGLLDNKYTKADQDVVSFLKLDTII